MFNNNNDMSDKATSLKKDLKEDYYGAKDTLLNDLPNRAENAAYEAKSESKDMIQNFKDSAMGFFSDAKEGFINLIKGTDTTSTSNSAPMFEDRPTSDLKSSATDLKNDLRDATRDMKREASDSYNQLKNDAKDSINNLKNDAKGAYSNLSRRTESDPQEFVRELRSDLQTDSDFAPSENQARSILGNDILDPSEDSPSAYQKIKEGMKSRIDEFARPATYDPQEYVRELRSDLTDDSSRLRDDFTSPDSEEKFTSRFERLRSDFRDRDLPSQETKDKMNQASDYMKDTYQDMKSRASNTMDRAESRTEEGMSHMKDSFDDMKLRASRAEDSAEYKMRQASDSMKDTYQDVKSRASNALDRAESRTEEGMSRMKDSLDNMKSRASNTMSRAEDSAEYKMRQASDSMKDTYQDVKSGASSTLNKAEDGFNSMSDKLSDAASDAYKGMKGGAYTAVNKLNDGLNDFLHKPLSTVTLSTDPVTEERAWANKTDLTGTNIHEEIFD